MQRVDETSTLPFGLIASIQTRHRGLRHLELQQLRGASSYQTIPGQRFSVMRGEVPAEHDEAPDDSVADITTEIWDAARSHHASNAGDQRFQLQLYVAKKDGSIGRYGAKFSLADGADEDATSGQTADVIDARTRRDCLSQVLHEQLDYIKALHKNQGLHDQQRRDREDKSDRDFNRFSDGVHKVFGAIADILPRILDLRLDAMEDRIEATLEGAGMDRSKATADNEQWKGAIDSVKELFSGPVGQAGVAKLLGMSPEEAAKLVAQSPAATPASTPDAGEATDIRILLRRLGMSLSSDQQAKLRETFGEKFGANLMRAGMAGSFAESVKIAAGAFADITEEQAQHFDTILNETQITMVGQIWDVLEKIHDSKFS